jgi:hypothetical protein
MDIRSRTRRAVMLAALGALVVPATAGAAAKTPVITKVTPKNVNVGDTLTVHGKNFRSGKGKNTLLFKRDRGKALFVKAGLATRKKITITVPKSLEKYMAVNDGKPVKTRFRVRVLTSKLSKRFTARKASPVIGPEQVKPPTGGGDGAGGTGTVTLDPKADCDLDGLSNGLEQNETKTDPCGADTDNDGATDGYEYFSAIDLNNDDYRAPTASRPDPATRPYPNPLDPSDAGVDHDGDSLPLLQEFELWIYSGGADPSQGLSYSAGKKYSNPSLSAVDYDKQAQFKDWLVQRGYDVIDLPDEDGVNFFDLDRSGDDTSVGTAWPETSPYDSHGWGMGSNPDGVLSDDERDEDADGLSNWVETKGQMLPDWYASMYPGEPAYPVKYEGVSPTDPDSDGDGVRDGADDQDHDDVPNYHELSRNMVVGGWTPKNADLTAGPDRPAHGRVNPYNPCLPFDDSRTCPISYPFGHPWAPFHSDELNYFVWN